MKNLNLSIVFGLLITLFGLNSCVDIDDTLSDVVSKDVITKDSELFQLISKVTKDEVNPAENIVCLDFIYPFKVLIYNTDRNLTGNKILVGDKEFSDFLGSLNANQSISISYPIRTTLADGTVFSVTNNSELKLAIDSCAKEDIINYCSGLFGTPPGTCVWKIPYTADGDNKYATGFFESKGDGTLNFTYNNVSYTGTWVFLFVDNKLHININLEGTSKIAQDLNIDSEIEFTTDEIIIKGTPKNTILTKSCEDTKVYTIGKNGPAGGLVFYDKGSYSSGWRYMEVAPTDLGFFEWGCLGSQILDSDRSELGTGFYNAVKIANYHDGLLGYYLNPSICNALNNGTVVSKKALLFELKNQKDWFLPSKDELKLVYENLYLQSVGGFSDSKYWTSSQIDANAAQTIDFKTGIDTSQNKIPVPNNIKARAVRYF
jgi:hypothetical protein